MNNETTRSVSDRDPNLEAILEADRQNNVIIDKQLRKEIDAIIQRLKPSNTNPLRNSHERRIAIVKLQEAVMWLGMDLKALGEQNPYPNSKDPSNVIVDKTADGLKL